MLFCCIIGFVVKLIWRDLHIFVLRKMTNMRYGIYIWVSQCLNRTIKNALRQTDCNAEESGIQCHHDQPHRFCHSPLEGDDGEDDSDEHDEEHPNLAGNAGRGDAHAGDEVEKAVEEPGQG